MTNVGTNAEIRQHLKLNTKEQLQAASHADVSTETEAEVGLSAKTRSSAKGQAHIAAKATSKMSSKLKSRDEDDQTAMEVVADTTGDSGADD